MNLDMAGLAALRHEANQLAARFGNALRANATYIGEDPSGAVRVTVDGAGHVVDVHLADSGPAHPNLGDAVLAAVEDANLGRLRSWAEAAAAPDAGDATPRSPSRPDPSPTEDLLTLLRQVEDQLDTLSRQIAEAAHREVVGRGAHGLVTVTLRGGEVVGVHLDRHWLATVSRPRIATDLKAAFDDAYPILGDAPPLPGSIAELAAITADFDALLRHLGAPETRA